MLKLTDIKKTYDLGGQNVEALRSVSLSFRKNEFVAVLGPSGCGKTTLLNIIGGLDGYTDGDLEIKGVSTKKYGDREWDNYRNHSVGFVFQNYNLIPHQSILANVELALTLSGVSKSDRKRRAREALEQVGLGDQLNKRPNQLSGGQMQRVAIARAIVNNPEILLADEPTGALDSETSVQVMDILREIAADRLVIMVTHNPELAREYATRIIRLKDGLVTDDSMPYDREYSEEKLIEKRNRSMSFFTALGLSVNNLLTKKGRTIMTCFAGSIGIIGIALILSVSNGVNVFINKIQEDTLTKYPLTVEAESIDMTSMLEAMQGNAGKNEEKTEHEDGRVYESSGIARMFKSMSSITSLKNNVTDFKKYIEQSEEFNRYVSAIRYRYPVKMNMYYTDADGNIVKSDSESVLRDMYSAMGVSMGGISSAMLRSYSSGLNVWEELLPGKNGSIISETVTEQYDIVYGRWPEAKNEVILILNSNNELSDFVLYALGLKSSGEFKEILRAAIAGREINTEKKSWSYEEICSRSFRLILPCDAYQKQADGTYVDLSETSEGLTVLYNTADRYLEIKIVGIIRPNSNALFNMLTGAVGYTTGLTEYIIDRTSSSEIVTRQLEDKETDAISGLPFKTDEPAKDDSAKIEAFREFYNALDVSQKSAVARDILLVPSEEYLRNAFDAYVQQMGREGLISRITETYRQSMGITDTAQIEDYLNGMSDEQLYELVYGSVGETMAERYRNEMDARLASLSDEQICASVDIDAVGDEIILEMYGKYISTDYSDYTYDGVLNALGYVDKNTPSEICIYAATFSDKNRISDLVDEYNSGVSEENRIKMTDYVKLLMSSISTVINAITYVLIAFVGISLVVSSIMIGVITNISVLERIKEIGILRAIGASKGDIRRVFNAETFIIGLLSGVLGILVTLVLLLPINIILHYFTGISYLNAALPVAGALILILLSMALTIVAGLIPAHSASKKDPVVALRYE